MLLKITGSCCPKFETGQIFEPTAQDIFFVPWRAEAWCNNAVSVLIIIPLFITFGDKNYGNITIKIQNTTYYIYNNNNKQILLKIGI